mmetsp:Transcript_49521/g.78400  ORF Transcript_49521/g.78400 Transcript_49521/m.78400 type:complete len:281 (+) Transcript_49521:497-1339(+)
MTTRCNLLITSSKVRSTEPLISIDAEQFMSSATAFCIFGCTPQAWPRLIARALQPVNLINMNLVRRRRPTPNPKRRTPKKMSSSRSAKHSRISSTEPIPPTTWVRLSGSGRSKSQFQGPSCANACNASRPLSNTFVDSCAGHFLFRLSSREESAANLTDLRTSEGNGSECRLCHRAVKLPRSSATKQWPILDMISSLVTSAARVTTSDAWKISSPRRSSWTSAVRAFNLPRFTVGQSSPLRCKNNIFCRWKDPDPSSSRNNAHCTIVSSNACCNCSTPFP